MDDTHEIHLTESGNRIARDAYERNSTLRQLLTGLGVDEKTAAADACEMEHIVSKESYEALKALVGKAKGGYMGARQHADVSDTHLRPGRPDGKD